LTSIRETIHNHAMNGSPPAEAKYSSLVIPSLAWVIVAVIYTFRRSINSAGFPIDPYYSILFAIPILLILAKKFPFADLGIRLGKPLTGLFFVLLLPGILFLRYYLTGANLVLPENLGILIPGSIAEEFFFRGYLQESLQKTLGTGYSFFLTNLLFALLHFIKGYSLAPTLVVGVIGFYFSLAKDQKQGGGSLIYPTISHILYNIVSSGVSR